MRRLAGRAAVITGGARGIGFGIAQRFALEGASVLLVDLLEDQLKTAAAELRDKGASVETLVADVAATPTPTEILRMGEAAFGKIDILVNNAGFGGGGSLEKFTDEMWDRSFAVHLRAPFRIARSLVPPMAKRGFGRVINISSCAGVMGMREDTAYSAAKSGLNALSRSIAADYGRYGVTANSVAPGPTLTPRASGILNVPASWFTRLLIDNKPISGLGSVEDIAGAAAFLASADGRFTTGAVIPVDGGLSVTRYVPDDHL